MPNTTTSASIRFRISVAAPESISGSPGPFDKKTPSGSRASTSAALVLAGTYALVYSDVVVRRIGVYIYLQKYMVEGLTAGSVKG